MVNIRFKPRELKKTLENRGASLGARRMINRMSMSADAKKAEEAEEAKIEEGLKKLSRRILIDTSFPEVPDYVWDECYNYKGNHNYANMRECSSDPVEDEHVAAIQVHLPNLDESVIRALLDASDYDHCSQEMMITMGNHFAVQGWDKEQLQQFLIGMYKSDGRPKPAKLESMSYAELIVDMVVEIVYCSSNGIERPCHSDMENTADLMGCISFGELKKIANDEGISADRDATRPSLIVKIIEYLYEGALGPAEAKRSDAKDTRQAKKARTMMD